MSVPVTDIHEAPSARGSVQPPWSPEAEQVVLGSVLVFPGVFLDLTGQVDGSDFYEPKNEIIWNVFKDLYDNGKPVEMPAVIAALGHIGALEKVGGAEYIARLLRNGLPSTALYYASLIREKAAKRRLIQMHRNGVVDAADGSGKSLETLIDSAQEVLNDISDRATESELVQVRDTIPGTVDLIEAMSKNPDAVTGVPTGLVDLDEATSGFHPGQMIVIAARPGVGKSTLGLDMLRHATMQHGMVGALFSLEMSRNEINTRLLSAEARVPLQNLRNGQMSEENWTRVGAVQERVYNARLFIDDTAETTMSQIRAKAHRLRQQQGRLDLIVIDYLQLLAAEGRHDSRQAEVSQISRKIKLLAKDLGVPTVVMSQLNRNAERASDGKPKVSDLRESGSIEQDADMVLLIHREEVFDPTTARVGEADLIIGKQRSGPTKTIVATWQGKYSRFVNGYNGD